MGRPIAKSQYTGIRLDVAEGKEPAPGQTAELCRNFAEEFLEHYRATRRENSVKSMLRSSTVTSAGNVCQRLAHANGTRADGAC